MLRAISRSAFCRAPNLWLQAEDGTPSVSVPAQVLDVEGEMMALHIEDVRCDRMFDACHGGKNQLQHLPPLGTLLRRRAAEVQMSKAEDTQRRDRFSELRGDACELGFDALARNEGCRGACRGLSGLAFDPGAEGAKLLGCRARAGRPDLTQQRGVRRRAVRIARPDETRVARHCRKIRRRAGARVAA